MKKLFLVGALALGMMSFNEPINPIVKSDEAISTCIEQGIAGATEALENGYITIGQFFGFALYLQSICENQA